MKIIHEAPSFLLKGKKVRLSFATDADGLSLTVNGKAVKVKKSGEIGELSVYTAELKPAGETLEYSVAAGEGTRSFCASVIDDPGLPPLAITEVFARPKGIETNVYLEVVNPTDAEVDLYDYKLMQTEEGVSAALTDMLSDGAGKYILAPGEVAVLWFRFPALINKCGTDCDGEFAAACNSLNRRPEFEVDGSARVIPIEISTLDGEKAVMKKGCFILQGTVNRRTELHVVPRDGEPSDAVYTLYMNRVYAEADNPVKRSSLWTVAYPDTHTARNLRHAYELSPGRLESFQRLPDVNDPCVPLAIDGSPEKVYTADGLSLRFSTDGHARAVTVSVKQADGSFKPFETTDEGDGKFALTLSAEELAAYSDFEYTVRIEGGLYCSEQEARTVTLYDNLGPSIDYFFPCEGFWFEARGNHRIYAEYSDPSGIDAAKTEFYLDGRNRTSKCRFGKGKMLYCPGEYLSEGQHTAELIVYDLCGNVSSLCRVFSVASEDDELKLFCGQVHSHTGDSDGSWDPERATVYARDVGGMDFFSVTDHSHYESADVYAAQRKLADEFEVPGEFADLYGFEMTWNYGCGWWGHMNVLNTSWINGDIYGKDLKYLLDRVSADPRAVAMFNHPCTAWGNFGGYAYHSPEADRRVCLAEIKGSTYDWEYTLMLSKGWHASPAFNEDNHAPNWGTATESTTYIAAPALTRDNVLEAFRNRRTYSSGDPTLKIVYKVNGRWFGSRLRDPSRLHFDISLSTEKEDGLGSVEVVAEDGIVVAKKDAGAKRQLEWHFDLRPDFDYYYLRIRSGARYSVTAPIWVISERGPVITELTAEPTDDPSLTDRAILSFKSANGKAMRNVRADLYLTPTAGFELDRAEPFRTLELGDLAAGKRMTVKCPIPYVAGRGRLSVVLSCAGFPGRRYDTSFVRLFPVTVEEVMSLTSAEDGAKNPFPYVRLRNRTARELSLDGMGLQLWHKTGKLPGDDRTVKLDGLRIAPKGALTVWIDGNGGRFTADDFNARHGTSLTEGVDLVRTEQNIVSAKKDHGLMLELTLRGEAIDRASWNYVGTDRRELCADVPFTYTHVPNKEIY